MPIDHKETYLFPVLNVLIFNEICLLHTNVIKKLFFYCKLVDTV